jgi:hypothetical protein
VLNFLVLAGGDKTALRNHRCGQGRGECPVAEATKGKHEQQNPDDSLFANGPGNVTVPLKIVQFYDIAHLASP